MKIIRNLFFVGIIFSIVGCTTINRKPGSLPNHKKYVPAYDREFRH